MLHFRLPFNGRKLPQDLLAQKVVERMEELRTCDFCGHAAWCCPDGCHTVPLFTKGERQLPEVNSLKLRGANNQCDSCEALIINGVYSHQSGCPNTGKRLEDGE